ncbi:MAG: magnesium/cobalt transporter CorA [Candidatus Caenarcaniphilales bacterium]|nr:magnesium/cobalt transporter CorA [Candidatus Caenarcaniphilales bacterium]
MGLSKLFQKHKAKIDSVPGLILENTEDSDKTRNYLENYDIESITFNKSFYSKDNLKSEQDLNKVLEACSDDKVTWININSNSPDIVKYLGDKLGIHSLVQEDINKTFQRPKAQDWDEYIFVVLKMLRFDEETKLVINEQISFILGSNYLVSFQEKKGDVFDQVRNRIINSRGRIRSMPVSYLLYSLLDTIVDNYYLVLDSLNKVVEAYELQLETDLDTKVLRETQKLKSEITYLRRFIFPVKELSLSLKKLESDLIGESVRPFILDLEDNAFQAAEAIELLREYVLNILDSVNTVMNNKMNEIMKLLTMVSSVFIPVTFIAGVYGMNFEFMPELKIAQAYPMVLITMSLVALAMIIYFKIKKWW